MPLTTITASKPLWGMVWSLCTSGVSNVRLSLSKFAFGGVVLEDKPGFDNSDKEDLDILKIIADWLKSTYVLVFNPQHYCFDVISADMKRIFCSAASSTFIEYLTIKCRSIYTCTFSRNSAAKALSIRSILTTTMWDKVIEEMAEKWECKCSKSTTSERCCFMILRQGDSLPTRQINFWPHRTLNRSSFLLQEELVDMRKIVSRMEMEFRTWLRTRAREMGKGKYQSWYEHRHKRMRIMYQWCSNTRRNVVQSWST